METVKSITKLWKPPRTLGKHGRDFWRRAGTYLVKNGILTELDRTMFEVLCGNYQLMMEIKEYIAQSPPLEKDRQGGVKKNPLFSTYRTLHSTFEKSAADFYLMPKTRARLKIEPNLTPLDGKGRYFE